MDTKHKPRRRRFTNEFRRQVVEETLTGEESVSVVARRHDLNTNQLFRWRRRYQRGELSSPSESPGLLPIRLTPSTVEKPSGSPPTASAPSGRLDIALAGGHRLSVHGEVDAGALRLVLETLR